MTDEAVISKLEIGKGMIESVSATGPTPLAPAPAGPPLTPEEVSREVEAAATDPKHEHYAHLNGRPTLAGAAWKSGLYARIRGADAPISVEGGLTIGGAPSPPAAGSPEADLADAAFRREVATELQAVAVDLPRAKAAGDRLFAGADGEAALVQIENSVLMSLPPVAEKRAHVEMGRFLAAVERIRQAAPPAVAGEPAFQPAFEAALQKAFGPGTATARRQFQRTLAQLVPDPAMQQLLERRLFEGLSTAARVETAVCAVKAVQALIHVRTYRS